MKKTALILAISTLASSGCYPQSNLPHELQDALRYGAKAKLTTKIIDEHGVAVTNANVSVAYREKEEIKSKHGINDADGIHVAEVKSQRSGIGGQVSKDGYYTSSYEFPFISNHEEIIKDGRWQPWNPTIPVVLRDIRNPIPMYVKRFHGYFDSGATVGFDCLKGDFIAPHGSGETADFTIHAEVGGIAYQHMTKSVSIDSIDSDGGFMTLKKHNQSDFKSDYNAPEFGYITNLVANSVYDRNKGEVGRHPVLFNSGNQYLVFKSRIVRDAENKVISANYGKIYTDFGYARADDEMKRVAVNFTYYFNPTPNDRNLEFDGKDPLFKTTDRRKPHEWSREP